METQRSAVEDLKAGALTELRYSPSGSAYRMGDAERPAPDRRQQASAQKLGTIVAKLAEE